MRSIGKVVLAYSGGLDTSIILQWLRDTYGVRWWLLRPISGRGRRWSRLDRRRWRGGLVRCLSRICGRCLCVILFFRCCGRMRFMRGGVPVGDFDRAAVDCKAAGGDRRRDGGRCGGAWGDGGRGMIRCALNWGYYALAPDIKGGWAPWREWDLNSRERLMVYAREKGIPIEQKRGTAAPYSMDANLLHVSYEGGELEDPACPPPATGMWRRTVDIVDAPELPAVNGDLILSGGMRWRSMVRRWRRRRCWSGLMGWRGAWDRAR